MGTTIHRSTAVLTYNSKIENFIRTKYESKRWVMDGGIPDPATLDVADDDVVSRNTDHWHFVPNT